MLTELPGMESSSQFSGIPNHVDVHVARPLLVYKVSCMNLKMMPLLDGCRMAWQLRSG